MKYRILFKNPWSKEKLSTWELLVIVYWFIAVVTLHRVRDGIRRSNNFYLLQRSIWCWRYEIFWLYEIKFKVFILSWRNWDIILEQINFALRSSRTNMISSTHVVISLTCLDTFNSFFFNKSPSYSSSVMTFLPNVWWLSRNFIRRYIAVRVFRSSFLASDWFFWEKLKNSKMDIHCSHWNAI